MKYLIDAQLPYRLKKNLDLNNCLSFHVLDFDNTAQLTDNEIIEISIEKNLIVISKDVDFLNSYLLTKRQSKLLLLSTGNISNNDLMILFNKNITQINKAFERNNLIELNQDNLIIH